MNALLSSSSRHTDVSQVTATFEMGGVKKQDMHVSFRANRIVVTWRRTRVIEKMEGSIKVRERQEKQYNQIIPLPEGTKVRLSPNHR